MNTARIRAFFGVQDMTEGSPMAKLAQFSIPLIIGNFAQQMYNTVDSIVVGNNPNLGLNALAAVGLANPILNLMYVVFMGLATGASIMAAQYFGAKDRETLSRTVGTTITLTFLSSLVMMVVGYFATPLLIGLIAPADEPTVGQGATVYLQIIFLGILGSAAYNIFSGVLRGVGDSVNPLIYLIVACLLNIVLDIVLVNLLNDVSAVAWATIIAQFVSGGLCLWRLTRMRDLFTLDRKVLRPDKKLTKKLVGLGLPSGITQGLFSMSAMVVQGLTSAMGTVLVAANNVIMRVDGFAMMPNFTFSTAATTYVGQNIGAGRGDRVRAGVPAVLKLALGTAAVLVALILIFGSSLITLFINAGEKNTDALIALGTRGLRWLSLGYIAFAVTASLQGAMRGIGETRIPMWISIITTIIIRLPLAYLMAALTRSADWPNGHPDAIFSSLLISWLIGMEITVFIYYWGRWRQRIPNLMGNG